MCSCAADRVTLLITKRYDTAVRYTSHVSPRGEEPRAPWKLWILVAWGSFRSHESSRTIDKYAASCVLPPAAQYSRVACTHWRLALASSARAQRREHRAAACRLSGAASTAGARSPSFATDSGSGTMRRDPRLHSRAFMRAASGTSRHALLRCSRRTEPSPTRVSSSRARRMGESGKGASQPA